MRAGRDWITQPFLRPNIRSQKSESAGSIGRCNWNVSGFVASSVIFRGARHTDSVSFADDVPNAVSDDRKARLVINLGRFPSWFRRSRDEQRPLALPSA